MFGQQYWQNCLKLFATCPPHLHSISNCVVGKSKKCVNKNLLPKKENTVKCKNIPIKQR